MINERYLDVCDGVARTGRSYVNEAAANQRGFFIRCYTLFTVIAEENFIGK